MPVISTIAAATARAFGAFKSLGGAADEFFDYVTLLLHGDGTNGAQNNTFLDSSTNNFTITRNGNTTQGTFSPFSQTGWSNYFDGSGDYISVPDSADFTMGSGDFTVQCWVYSTANSGSDQYILGQVTSGGQAANTSFQLYKKATSNVAEAYVYAGSGKVATASATIPVEQWTHLAMCRDGGTLRLYVNGVQSGTNATLSTTAITDSGGSFAVGRTGDYDGLYFSGYVSNVSVVKGTCLFPSGTTFTPSTAPLSTSTSGQSVLLCQANRFVDTNTATTAKTVTVGGNTSVQVFSPFAPTAAYSAATVGGSGYFDGSGDYLTTPTSSQFTAAGDFTISCWFMLQSFAASSYVVGGNWSAGTSDEWLIQIQNNGAIRFLTSADSTFSSSGVVSLNQWTFFSATRSGSTVTVQVNGTTVRTYTKSDTLGSATKSINIGQQPGNNWPFLGYITDFRLVSGSAITTIPTSPLTAISGTGLLCNFTNAGIFDNTAKNVLETVGNAQISTSVKKFGTGSLAFDGTGDYLVLPPSPNLAFGTGDFTIEFWLNSSDGNANLIGITTNASGNWNLVLAGSSLYWQNQYSQANLYNRSATSILDGNWHHIAITRSSGTSRMFFDGVVQGASVSDTTSYVSAHNMQIGSSGVYGDLNGYIDDLRITKGIARYTSNFTPPTAAFKDQ